MENLNKRSRRPHFDTCRFLSLCHLSSILLVLILATLPLGCGASRSKEHTLFITGIVHVYRTDTPPMAYPGPDFIAVVGPQDKVEVRRIVYKSNYVAVKIKLSDGREGWVFSGESIELREQQKQNGAPS